MYNSSQRVKLSSRRTAGYFKRVSRVSRDRLGPRRWLFRINRRREIGFVVRYVRRRRDYLRNRLESSSCEIEREYRQVLGPWAARLGTRRSYLSYCRCVPFLFRLAISYPLACLRMKMMHSDVMGVGAFRFPNALGYIGTEGPTGSTRTSE